jgi:hypothetical protein
MTMSTEVTLVMTVPRRWRSREVDHRVDHDQGSQDTCPQGHSREPEPHCHGIGRLKHGRDEVRAEQEVQQMHQSEHDGREDSCPQSPAGARACKIRPRKNTSSTKPMRQAKTGKKMNSRCAFGRCRQLQQRRPGAPEVEEPNTGAGLLTREMHENRPSSKIAGPSTARWLEQRGSVRQATQGQSAAAVAVRWRQPQTRGSPR